MFFSKVVSHSSWLDVQLLCLNFWTKLTSFYWIIDISFGATFYWGTAQCIWFNAFASPRVIRLTQLKIHTSPINRDLIDVYYQPADKTWQITVGEKILSPRGFSIAEASVSATLSLRFRCFEIAGLYAIDLTAILVCGLREMLNRVSASDSTSLICCSSACCVVGLLVSADWFTTSRTCSILRQHQHQSTAHVQLFSITKTMTEMILRPIHTADADATKLFCRVGVGGVNTIRN